MLCSKEVIGAPVTGYFLVPFLGLKFSISSLPGFVSYYHRLKKNGVYQDEGQYVYAVFDGEDVPAIVRSLPMVDAIEVINGRSVVRLRLPDEVVEQIVPLFIQGKYSHFPKELVDKYFPRDPNDLYFGNRLVIMKDDSIRQQLAEELDVSIPPDVELWQTYNPSKETLEI